MVFSTVGFLFVFLPLTVGAFVVARRWLGPRAGLAVLAAASLVFYGMWNQAHLAVLLGSVMVNCALAAGLTPGRPWTRALLSGAVGANLLLLAWFKYAAFLSGILVSAGVIGAALPARALPLGISFFTFQTVAYLVDRARGLAPHMGLWRHLLFISFFPQLVAGPIVHHGDMMPQLDRARASAADGAVGLFILAAGLFKKVVIADSLAYYADAGFASPAGLPLINAWALAGTYTLQLYFDFSGYSDMATGLARFFGVRLPANFLSPYKATSVAAFWRRWHVTLSEFLKRYVYIPLGGSRAGGGRTAANLLLTMLLGGIWHGAGWTFILWGAIHGAALVMNHAWRSLGIALPAAVGWGLTMVVVVLGWVPFRAESLADAAALWSAMLGGSEEIVRGYDGNLLGPAPYLLAGTLLALACPNSVELAERFRPTLLWALWTGVMLAAALAYVLGRIEPPEFLYYEF